MKPIQLLMLGVSALASACTVGPNYRTPDTPTPPAFSDAALVPAAVAGVAPRDLSTWWAQFDDRELSSLVERAMQGNLDLKTAAARVRAAREQLTILEANRLPQVNGDADASALHLSQNSGFGEFADLIQGGSGGSKGADNGLALPGGNIITYTLGFDASWEIDVFGGTRRGIEAAQAVAEQAVWNQRDSEVSLAAEVASDYWLLRSVQRQIVIAGDEVARQQQLLSLLQARRQFGFVTDQDVRAQAAQLASVQGALPDLDAEREAQIHALGVLIGEAPEALEAELSSPGALAAPPPGIPVGLPSDLLRRRPDVRAAERALAASSARIGVAVADLYPKINLTGSLDLVSLDLRHLLEGSSRQYDGAGAFSWPLFAGGSGRANVRVVQAQNRQALYTYQKTVLNALEDVENALTRYGDELRKNRALRDALTQAQGAADVSQGQYQAGVINIAPVLTDQGSVLQAQNQLAQSDDDLDRDLASLYKALGGGWHEAQGQSG